MVEAHWVDEKGERHFEQGDGPLILRKPGDLALAVGKLGNTLYWLGSDGARFWLFDLTGGPTRAYIGRANDGGRIQSRLPLPLRPDLLMGLIGLTPLPDSNETAVNVVRDEENPGRFRYRVRLPVEGTPDLQRVIVLDPETNHPVRISFRGSGETLLRADLSRYQRLPLADSSPSAWPDVPTRIEITAPGRDARFTLFLSDLTEGKNKIRDAQFDLDRLMEIHDPDEVRTLPSPSPGRP